MYTRSLSTVDTIVGMKLLTGLGPFTEIIQGCVAAVGNFDGVHLGHQAMIQALNAQAKAMEKPSLVILFEPQPAEYFSREQCPSRLTSFTDKLLRLQKLQVDLVHCIPFNQTLAKLDPTEFIEQILFQRLNVCYLMSGKDFRFGKQRKGDTDLLGAKFRANQRAFKLFADFQVSDERVSSTSIREALSSGNLLKAHTLLGETYHISRKVVRGQGQGQKWGIPTANFAMAETPLPVRGVFCVQAKLEGARVMNGVANVGQRPTVGGKKNILEVHLFDFNQIIYGRRVEIYFLSKLRDEKKFDSIVLLIRAISKDIQDAKAFLESEMISKAVMTSKNIREAAKLLGVAHSTVVRKAQKYRLQFNDGEATPRSDKLH